MILREAHDSALARISAPLHNVGQSSDIAMDLNRNQFFFLGLLVLLVGAQFRFVSTYTLNPEATKFLAERTGDSQAASVSFLNMTGGAVAGPRKVIQPPEWVGWSLISLGSVLVLHSLAMGKPGG